VAVISVADTTVERCCRAVEGHARGDGEIVSPE